LGGENENVFYFHLASSEQCIEKTYSASLTQWPAREVTSQALGHESTITGTRQVSVNERFNGRPALAEGVSPGGLQRPAFAEFCLASFPRTVQLLRANVARDKHKSPDLAGAPISYVESARRRRETSSTDPLLPRSPEANGGRIRMENERNLLQFSIGTRFDTGYPRFSSSGGCSGGDIHG
jgi:hypothetical protein